MNNIHKRRQKIHRMTTGKEEYSESELLKDNKNCPLCKKYAMSNHIHPKASTPGNAKYFNQRNEALLRITSHITKLFQLMKSARK